MATGASNAELAVMLVDARKGLLTQTFRHADHRLAARHPSCRAGGEQDRSRRFRRGGLSTTSSTNFARIRRAARLSRDRRRSRSPRASATMSRRAAPDTPWYRGAASARSSRDGRGRGGPPRRAVPHAGAMGQSAASRFSRLCRHDRQRRDRARATRSSSPRPAASARSRASSPPTATSRRRTPATR